MYLNVNINVFLKKILKRLFIMNTIYIIMSFTKAFFMCMNDYVVFSKKQSLIIKNWQQLNNCFEMLVKGLAFFLLFSLK
jgi:hypothetical protein